MRLALLEADVTGRPWPVYRDQWLFTEDRRQSRGRAHYTAGPAAARDWWVRPNRLDTDTVDAPWCSITNSHASRHYLPSTDSLFIPRVNKPEKFAPGLGVKGRQEPADVVIIAHVVAAIRGESVAELMAAVWCNSCSLFWPESTVTD